MKILADINTRKNDIFIFICFVTAAVLLAWAAWTAWINIRTTPPEIDKTRYPVAGIDISSHNGTPDFHKAASDGVEFAWIKASEGSSFRDKNFSDNHHLAGKAGLKRGAYHFFRFDKDGVEQAMNLLDAIGNRHLEMGMAIDVESSGNPEGISEDVIRERLASMVDYLNLRGIAPTLYCNKKDYFKYMEGTFPGHYLWVCSLSEEPSVGACTFWQYSHKGNVKGIKGDVDMNVFGGSRSEWNDFINAQQYQSAKYVN